MKRFLLMLLLLITAVVLGGLCGIACEGVPWLDWLSYSQGFAFEPGKFINIDGVFSLTFGITFSPNVAQLILCLISLFVYYKLAPKLCGGK